MLTNDQTDGDKSGLGRAAVPSSLVYLAKVDPSASMPVFSVLPG